MKYVLDSSVAFKWALTEIDSDAADRLRDDFRNAVHELIAPDVFQIELTHALTRAERQRRILLGEAEELWNEVMTTPPALHPNAIPRAIQISSSAQIGVYDCLYVALAESEGCELVTADDKLLKNLQTTFPFVISLSSLP